jgi:hypothetical protein
MLMVKMYIQTPVHGNTAKTYPKYQLLQTPADFPNLQEISSSWKSYPRGSIHNYSPAAATTANMRACCNHLAGNNLSTETSQQWLLQHPARQAHHNFSWCSKREECVPAARTQQQFSPLCLCPHAHVRKWQRKQRSRAQCSSAVQRMKCLLPTAHTCAPHIG